MNIIIDSNAGETKLQQLINGLLQYINAGCTEGDILPSVNALSKQLGISRDTVFKAYSELKRRKVVDSTPTRGYFVNRDINKVLLLLDYYSPFKDIVYREFERNLDSTWSIDLVFHHYNQNLFDSVILECVGRYNYFIVMNIDTKTLKIAESLKKLDPSKLLLLDIPIEDWQSFDQTKYNFLWQDFDNSVFEALNSLSNEISAYKKFNLIYTNKLQHPTSTLKAYEKFCKQINLEANIITDTENLTVSTGEAYFILRQSDLYTLLTACKKNGLSIGNDIGILAYNDIPLYEFVSCGITVISANFKKMGKLASEFVLTGKPIQQIIYAETIKRQSI